jgi:type VI secretion system secreted protein Hcp
VARSDMFLKAIGKKTGEIFGESNDKTFAKQMDVVDWSWGMQAPSAVGSFQRTGRVAMSELKVIKRVDKASTALMATMSNNEILSSAVLTVRKAGGVNSVAYVVVTLTNARINDYRVQADIEPDGAPTLTEHFGLAFETISFDYSLQSTAGAVESSSNFTGQAGPAT